MIHNVQLIVEKLNQRYIQQNEKALQNSGKKPGAEVSKFKK